MTATDGEEALDVYNLHKTEIDIVLLDLGLPKIVIATGYLELELKAELFRTGVRDCINKSYFVNDVLEKLVTVIESVPNSAGT